MRSRFVTPKYERFISAVVLSANDVVATVFILDVDEDGIAIKTAADVSLPFEARNYRQKHPEGKSMFQRGDVIQIRCEVSKENEKISDETIEKMLASFLDMEDENAELYHNINENARSFTRTWLDLCKRDLAKRATSKTK